jgi:hypothetical protein
MSHDITMGDDSPQKRKRPLEDLGDREQKKVHIENCKFGIEDLHLNVGEKYLLCQTRKTPFNLRCTNTSTSYLPCSLSLIYWFCARTSGRMSLVNLELI